MGLFEQMNASAATQDSSSSPQLGVTLATVTDINDPEKLDRVKCKYISANADALELDWAYVMTPFAGKSCGIYFMPNVDDTVLVLFENGDIRRPLIIGSMWGKLQTPPQKLDNGKNEVYKIVTPNKSSIEFADTAGKEKITLKTPANRQVVLDDENKSVKLSDPDNSITFDGNTGEVKIVCKSKLTIQVGSGNSIVIDGNAGSVTITGTQSVKLDGMQVEVAAKTNATIKANAQISVESSGITQVKGSMLKLN